MSEKIAYDNDLIQKIDEEMGWIEKDGSSPSKTASEKGCDCKFMDGPFSATAWCDREDGVWSVCVLSGITTTLLAKSFRELERLYRKLRERQKDESKWDKWKRYYKRLWMSRYFRWCCTKELDCQCQLCRMKCANK